MLQHIRYLEQQLSRIYPLREAKNIALLVAEAITGKGRMDFYLQPDKELTYEQQAKSELYLKALMDNQPVQYVLGEAHFLDMTLTVTPDVLIPRPETEELVLLVANELKQKPFLNPRLLDIGTGSGCIALGLSKLLPQAQVFGLDISRAALNIAKENAQKYDLEIAWIEADILKIEEHERLPHQLDAIISNPPYIPLREKQDMTKQVIDYEPHLALFVPDNEPLLFYRAIATFAQKALNPKGSIFFEIHENYAQEVFDVITQSGFVQVKVYPDLSGRQRMISAQMP